MDRPVRPERGDTAVYLGRGNADGTFEIHNVPDGTYTLTYWDEPQDYILDLLSVTVSNGEVVDMGVLPLAGWFTKFDGYVFNDTNRNGKRDAGEPGVPNFGLTLRKRENSLMDRGSTAVSTNQSGYYAMEQAYPLTEWLVLEAYDDRYYTTGITYQADNQPSPRRSSARASTSASCRSSACRARSTGAFMPTTRRAPTASTRRTAGSSAPSATTRPVTSWTRSTRRPRTGSPACPGSPSSSGRRSSAARTPATPCDARGDYELAPDGSYAEGKLLNTYVSETWERPSGCVARDVDGDPLSNPGDQQVLPQGADGPCLEGPLMGVQFGPYPTDQGTPDANFGAAVDGNYGFGDGCFDGTLDASDPAAPECVGGEFTSLDAGDYLVHVDLAGKVDARGEPIYKVTREEDINIGNGDQFVPAVPPPACAGALHTVDVADMAPDGPDATVNPTFVDIGGSPYEGQARPLCDTKLVALQNGKSVVPMFNVFTDVPLPGRFFGLNVDDLDVLDRPDVAALRREGRAAIQPGRDLRLRESPDHDRRDRLQRHLRRPPAVHEPDQLPDAVRRLRQPLPVRRQRPRRRPAPEPQLQPAVPDDRGRVRGLPRAHRPGRHGSDPGRGIGPAARCPQIILLACPVNDPAVTAANRAPELYAVSRPYTTGTLTGFSVYGKGFGASKGAGQLTLDGIGRHDGDLVGHEDHGHGQPVALDRPGTAPAAGHRDQRQDDRQRPDLPPDRRLVQPGDLRGRPDQQPELAAAKVSSGRWFTPAETLPATANHAIQNALNAAPAGALVVVYPNKPSADPRQNPRGAYYENLIISKRVKLQGVGPGSPDGSVPGSIIDGGAFGGDSPVATDWYARIDALTWAGNQTVYDGAVISLYLPSSGSSAFPTSYSATTAPTIDGFDLRGGDQKGFPGNINEIGGVPTGQPGGLVTQGGAIFANAYARNLQITNNVVQNNGGAYGTIRIGTPDLDPPTTRTTQSGSPTTRSRATAGPTSPAGSGSSPAPTATSSSGNDICGNFSAEYGGGLTDYGLQPERLDRPQPDLLQPVVRRGRRDHDRRRAADRSRRSCRPARARSRSTTT